MPKRRPVIDDQSFVIEENADVSLQVIAFDPDPGDSLTYSIISGNGDGLFVIDPLTGVITLADGGTFDYETDAASYTLVVQVTDSGPGEKSSTAIVTIDVTDVNEAPTSIALSNLSVDENAAGAVIGTVTATDQDDPTKTWGTVTLAVDDARFEVVDGLLKLKAGDSLDHETEGTVTVTVTATDGGGLSLNETFVIAVNDVNETPSAIALSNLSVDENAAGAAIGTLTVTDPDDPAEPFGTHAIAVDDARFEVVDGVLKLKAGVSLDHEAGETVTVAITATDGGGLSVSETFAITVNDLNEVPRAIALSNTSVDEIAAGAAVGTLTVADPDDPTQPFGTHALAVDDARFEIVNGVLKLKTGVSLDHEAGDAVTVTVTATDGGGLSVSETFAIAVIDVNEAPTAISLSNTSVGENLPGIAIGELTATDPDNPLESFGRHTFTVDDPRFHVVGSTLRLQSGVSLDHEAGGTVTVAVTAVDGGGAGITQTFDIQVTDANDAPSGITVSTSPVDEATPGAILGSVVVSDQDDPSGPLGGHDITVDDPRFEVIDGVLKLNDGAALDFADGSSVTLNITATDGGGLSVTRSHTVTVNEVDEAPILTVTATDTIAEEDTGATIAQATVRDPDWLDGKFGQITLSVDDPRFEAVFGQIKLKDGVALDFETEPTVTLTITATDITGLTDTATVTLNVLDVVEGKTFFSLGALDGSNGARLFSTNPADIILAYSVSGAGDVNGDGYADLIIGVPIATAGPEAVDEGASYVVFGSAAGLPADFDLSLLDGTNGFRINGTDTDYGGLGVAVSGAGDFNGDGFADMLVSAVPIAAPAGTGWPPDTTPPTNEGFVIFGKADGWTPSVDLDGAAAVDSLRMFSSTASDGFADTVTDVGDFNGDGFADIAIGDPGAGAEGTSYVVFGNVSGWPTDLDLATLDGSNGFRITGAQQYDGAGFVRSAGDLNGDGYDDLAIGAANINEETESVYVVYGDAGPAPASLDLGLLDPAQGFRITGLNKNFNPVAISSAGDVNGDGHEDLIIGSWGDSSGSSAAYVVYGDTAGFPGILDISTLDGTNGFRIDGPALDVYGFNVGGAGDVNGDGIDDLMFASAYPDQAGSVYVMYGQDGGFADGLELSLVDGLNGFRLDGAIPFGAAGFSLDAAGDVNGDGFADLVIGAPFEPSLDVAAWGETYVWYGSDSTASVTGLGTAASDTLTGSAGADSLVGAQGDDILVGNGGADVLYGGAGDDILAVGDLSFDRIDGGSGSDTLRLDGAGQALDLTALGDAVIEGVERIDLTGSGDNALTLAVTDLLQISDESNDLFVAGDAGDQVTVVGDWQFTGAATVDGVTYNQFGVTGVDAALYVEQEVVVPGPAPITVALSNTSVDENADGAAIGTLTVSDPASLPGAYGFTVDDPRFEVVDGVLKLKAGQALDHESQDIVAVTVTATNGFTISQAFDIAVNDLNEVPTGMELSGTTIDEHAAGAVVGAVTVTDPDDPAGPFGAYTYTVDDTRFEVVDGVLKLKAAVSLDHGTGEAVTVTVTATDGSGSGVSETFAIAVNEVNDAPTRIYPSGLSIYEHVAGATVGTLMVADRDDPAQPFGAHVFAVDDARFEVVNGVLKLKAGVSLDADDAFRVQITVTATDGGGLSVSHPLSVLVYDANEAPTAIALSSATVDENAAGAAVGTLTVSDPDDPTLRIGMHSFSVDDARFEVVDGVLKLRDGVSLDHEAGPTVSVTVTAIDGGNLYVSETFTIAVNDMNDAPSPIALSNAAVDENAASAVVGTLTVNEPDDPTQPFRPHTVAVDDARFEVVDGVLRLKAGVSLDHEAGAIVAVTVTATAADGSGLSMSETFSIAVNDLNEAPVNLSVSASSIIEEHAGLSFGGPVASDPDDGVFGLVTFTVDDPRFEVVRSTSLSNPGGYRLKLKDGIALDFEAEPEVTLTVTGIDGGGVSISQTVTVPVTDINDSGSVVPVAYLDGSDGARLFSSDIQVSWLGSTVAGIGDVNGDGFDDFMVGADDPYQRASLVDGESFVVFGGADGIGSDVDLSLLDGSNGFSVSGSSIGGSGASVSAAGDLNGDGIADMLVLPTEPWFGGEGGYVVFGKATGWTADLDLSPLLYAGDGSDGFRVYTEYPSALFGSSVSAGDFNGDGLDDLIISDPAAGPGAGLGYVVFGRPEGWPTDIDLATLDGTNGFVLDGSSVGGPGVSDFNGYFSNAGDVNGDGIDDMAVSASSSLFGLKFFETKIVFGAADGWTPSVDLSTLDGSDGFQIGSEIWMFYGNYTIEDFEYLDNHATRSAGDVNGDGFEDLIIDLSYSNGTPAAYVLLGRDGPWPAQLDADATLGESGFFISGDSPEFIGMSVGSAGDVNGDGLDDLLVGALSLHEGATDYASYKAGGAYVVYGRPDAYGGNFDLTTIDTETGFRIDGAVPYGLAGFSVSAAGDIDGDGFDDLLIGAPEAGEAYVLYGGGFNAEVTSVGTAAADTLTGTAGADSLVGAQGDDILVGNGGADVLYGGAGDDILAVGDLTFDRIDGGGGSDTLRLDGAGQALDLTAIGDTVIEGVERVDLTGSGDNALTLAVTDLLQISDESNELFVAGDAGDQVTVVGDWQDTGPATVDGVAYTVYGVAGVDASLYVEDDVSVTTLAIV